MSRESAFLKFYKETLENRLVNIEAERDKEFKKVKAARKKGVIAGAVVAAFVAWGVMAMQPVESIVTFFQAFLVFGVFFCLVGLVLGNHFTIRGMEKFRLPFKLKVITPVIRHFNPTLTYHPEQKISDTEIAESRLFQEEISLYRGDDLIEGKEEDVKLRFSEVQLHIKVKKSDHNGTSGWVHHPFFKGIFLVAELPYEVIDTLIVRPNPGHTGGEKNKEYMRKLAEKQTRWSNRRYLDWSPDRVDIDRPLYRINTGDESFDEQFFTYSTDKQAAASLMKSKLKERLLVLKDMDYEQAYHDWKSGKSGGEFQIPAPYCAIIGNKFYLAKPYNRQFFNIDLERSVVGPHVTEQFFYEIRELTGLARGMTKAFQGAG